MPVLQVNELMSEHASSFPYRESFVEPDSPAPVRGPRLSIGHPNVVYLNPRVGADDGPRVKHASTI